MDLVQPAQEQEPLFQPQLRVQWVELRSRRFLVPAEQLLDHWRLVEQARVTTAGSIGLDERRAHQSSLSCLGESSLVCS